MLLASCADVPQPITQQADVPVYTPCVKQAPACPEFEFDKLPLDAADSDKVLALARYWPLGRQYEG